MKKTMLFNFLILILIVGMDLLYIFEGGIFIKATASALFFLLGLWNYVYARRNKLGNQKHQLYMLIGLFVTMIADVVINLHFISGAAIFAIGHVFYVIAYLSLIKLNWVDIFTSLGVFIPSVLFILLAPIFDFGGIPLLLVCVIYALIISCMLGKALSNLIKERNLLNILTFFGAFLFFFSDLMLLLNNFSNIKAPTLFLCLITYYPAQFLLAHTILLSANENIYAETFKKEV